ncbi:MAG TPA: sugar phosphate isomerase/epimerase family protein [Acidobacteriaceae bacterium]|nr:sugar phosphate isomerase/epimerase family protein [Acidobacteriaceae bacterium]
MSHSATPSRRQFLMQASALPLAAACGIALATPAEAEPQPIQRAGNGSFLKTSVNAYSFTKLLNAKIKHGGQGMDLYDVVDFCAKYNVDAFDATGYFFPGYPDTPPTDKYINELKLKAFESGVAISGSGVRNQFTTADKVMRDAGVAHIKQWVEIASQLGAPVLRVFADTQMRAKTWHDVAGPNTAWDDVARWIADDLRECAAHGEKHGVIIGVQNHGDFLRTADDQLKLIGMVNSKWCGAIVDTGYYRTPDPYVDMEKAAPYAVNWQIKQSAFGADSNVPIDMIRLLKIIRKSGYRGYIPLETLSTPGKEYDPFKVVPQYIQMIRDAIARTAQA